jgi:hypothetical protein
MRKISLFGGIVVLTLGMAAVSTAGSAFAMGCLDNQDSLPAISLSHNGLTPGAGFGYDKDGYDAAIAKGNACPATEQATPVSDTQLRNGKSRAHISNN